MKTHTLDKIIKFVKSLIRLPRMRKRGRPFTYSAKAITVFFHTMILKGITRFKTMHNFLIHNPSTA